jgi:three-Cys-motif partner protein
VIKEAIWDLKPHTGVKHDLLRGYLSAWFPILNKFNKRVVFIDGFAGPGTYANGEPGSPIIALTTFLDHGYVANMAETEYVFVFNEQDAARHESLESLLETERGRRGDWPPNVKVVVENKNFKDVAEEILAGLGSQSLAPTFAFVDPFGYKDVPMSLIKRLMSYSRSELFIYLDINSLTRFATAGNVDKHFEELFGTDEFKGAPSGGAPGRQQFLHDLYARQLKKECGFDFVQSFEMVGANGKTINYMFFCTRSLLGLDKMKSVMWKSAPSGDYRFIDRLAGQKFYSKTRWTRRHYETHS